MISPSVREILHKSPTLGMIDYLDATKIWTEELARNSCTTAQEQDYAFQMEAAIKDINLWFTEAKKRRCKPPKISDVKEYYKVISDCHIRAIAGARVGDVLQYADRYFTRNDVTYASISTGAIPGVSDFQTPLFIMGSLDSEIVDEKFTSRPNKAVRAMRYELELSYLRNNPQNFPLLEAKGRMAWDRAFKVCEGLGRTIYNTVSSRTRAEQRGIRGEDFVHYSTEFSKSAKADPKLRPFVPNVQRAAEVLAETHGVFGDWAIYSDNGLPDMPQKLGRRMP